MFVGSFYEWHDTDTLLAAFARLRADFPHARLMMVGDGRRRGIAEAKAQALGLGESVIFTKQVPHSEVPCLVNAADITVALCPQMAEDLWLSPMKLFEYMAAGKAIVATDEGQYAEVIEHERNGLLVGAGDVEGVHAALVRLIGDRGLRHQLGAQARHDALTQHSWACCAERLEAVYRQAIVAVKAAA
jgi:glycosyltransferase involved in cell wall biosynthesis